MKRTSFPVKLESNRKNPSSSKKKWNTSWQIHRSCIPFTNTSPRDIQQKNNMVHNSRSTNRFVPPIAINNPSRSRGPHMHAPCALSHKHTHTHALMYTQRRKESSVAETRLAGRAIRFVRRETSRRTRRRKRDGCGEGREGRRLQGGDGDGGGGKEEERGSERVGMSGGGERRRKTRRWRWRRIILIPS